MALAAAASLFWLATWTLDDYMPPLEDTVGAALAETSRGLFIASGLLAALVVLRISHRLGAARSASRWWRRVTVRYAATLAMRTALIASMVGLAVLVAPERSHACGCEPLPEDWPSDRLQKATAVFRGTVVNVRPFIEPDYGHASSRYDFAVTRVWKGPVDNELSVSVAHLRSTSCGYAMHHGKNYLVFADDGWTHYCLGTVTLSDGPLPPRFWESLGAGRAVSGTDWDVPLAIAMAAAGIAVGAVLLGRGLRRTDAA